METAVSVAFIVVILMLMFYMSAGACIEKLKLSFGHEASFTVCAGMILSFIEWYSGNEHFVDMLRFNDITFFYFCLPPIVFASGFNMQRGDFFKNISNVILLGVFGTIVAFGTFSLMTIGFKELIPMTMYKYSE